MPASVHVASEKVPLTFDVQATVPPGVSAFPPPVVSVTVAVHVVVDPTRSDAAQSTEVDVVRRTACTVAAAPLPMWRVSPP